MLALFCKKYAKPHLKRATSNTCEHLRVPASILAHRKSLTNLVVPPQPGQPVGVHHPEHLAPVVLPANKGFVPLVGKQLVYIVPQQPAIWNRGT